MEVIMWNILGETLSKNEKRQLMICPNAPGYEIPVTLICGERPGKTVAIAAGTHSDEYPGIAAVARMAKALNPAEISGNIIFIHCLNTSGFWNLSSTVDDRVNLNMGYPGSADGSPGQRIQAFIATQLFPHIDFFLDLHSGSNNERLTPCLFFPYATPSSAVTKLSMEVAVALDIPILLPSQMKTSQFTYCAEQKVPSLLLERGDFGNCAEENVVGYCRDINLVLNFFKLKTAVRAHEVCSKEIYYNNIYLQSEYAGLWHPAVKAGESVFIGQRLGHIEDFFGNVLHIYHAEINGKIFYHTASLPVKPGAALVAYGS